MCCIHVHFLGAFISIISTIFCQCSILIYHCSLRHMTMLTRQHIITSLVFKSGTSSLMQDLTDYCIRKLICNFCMTSFGTRFHVQFYNLTTLGSYIILKSLLPNILFVASFSEHKIIIIKLHVYLYT